MVSIELNGYKISRKLSSLEAGDCIDGYVGPTSAVAWPVFDMPRSLLVGSVSAFTLLWDCFLLPLAAAVTYNLFPPTFFLPFFSQPSLHPSITPPLSR